jgi:hypothetical protein
MRPRERTHVPFTKSSSLAHTLFNVKLATRVPRHSVVSEPSSPPHVVHALSPPSQNMHPLQVRSQTYHVCLTA